jgi:hypothetical protein
MYKSVDYKREPVILAILIFSVLLTIVSIVGNFVPPLIHGLDNQKNDYYNLLFLRLSAIILNVCQILYFGSRYFYTGFLKNAGTRKWVLVIYLACCLITLGASIYLLVTHKVSAAFWLALIFVINITYTLFYLISWYKCRNVASLPK